MTTEFKTSDLASSAYLICKGFIVDRVEEDLSNSRKKLFVFNRKPGQKIEDMIKEYNNRKAIVEPLEYFNALRELKNRIYA